MLPSVRIATHSVQFLSARDALVRDTRCPDVGPIVVPLHFAAGHSLSKFLAQNHSWQQCHTQFLPDHNAVYVGERGLRGGGGSMFHSCAKYGVYECKLCDFGKCPNNSCYKCCSHKDHGCADRQKTLQLERVKAQDKVLLSWLKERLDGVQFTEEDAAELLEGEDGAADLTAREDEEYVVQHQGAPDQDTATQPITTNCVQASSPDTCAQRVDMTTLYQSILSSDPVVQKDLLEYFSGGGTVSEAITAVHPVDQWLVRFLIRDLAASTHDPCVLSEFSKCWLNIAQRYQYKEQVRLLQGIKCRKLDLAQATEALYTFALAGELGLDFACDRDHRGRRQLKHTWVKKRLTMFQEEEQNAITSNLNQINWKLLLKLRFLDYITKNHINASDTISFLCIAKENKLPMAHIEEVILNPPEALAVTMRYELLYSRISRVIRDAEDIRMPLGKLRQIGCSVEALEQALDKNISSKSVQVVQQLCNFELSRDICQSALSISKQPSGQGTENCNRTDMSSSWISKVDQFVVNKLFDEPKVYGTDELILKIGNKALRDLYDEVVNAYAGLCTWNCKKVKTWAKKVRAGSPPSQAEMIAVVSRAVSLQHQFEPRDTQTLALLCLLHRQREAGILAQVNTGEGKSIIVAMLAVIKALKGRKVDVVTSSTELSIPEVKKQAPFFAMFDLTVAENSSRAERDVYKCDVVYGTATDFLGDILRKEFLGDDCRAGRPHDVVIVDEVDCMLFDNRTHSVRLAADTPGMNHLQLPLVTVWQHVHKLCTHLVDVQGATYFIPEDYKVEAAEITLRSGRAWEEVRVHVPDKEAFVTQETRSHLGKLLRDLDELETKELAEYKALQKKTDKLEKEINYLPEESLRETRRRNCEVLRRKENSLPWRERYPALEVPAHLRQFCQLQVSYWIKNALNATFAYKRDAHYTVKNDRIVPIHYNDTGALQENLTWSDGLTQFLQLKEGLPLDPEGFATNFMSNISFFRRYQSDIYGLTGTLGDDETQKFLHEIYGTDVVKIPPYRQRRIANNGHSRYTCKELAAIIVPAEQEWFDAIVAQASYHVEQQRAVLVILKYVSQVEDLAVRLANHRVWKYTGKDKFDKTHVDSGDIIIATNIAGRGTDLKTSDRVEDHGGLYVAVTFLPQSFRVELQNVGRTAREGKKGMAQLILHCPNMSDIQTLRKERQEHEAKATERAIKDAKNVFVQDELFRHFCSLESKLLPSATVCEKTIAWQQLTTEWEEYEDRKLSSDKFKHWLKKKIHLIEVSSLSSESKEQYDVYEARKISELESGYSKTLLQHFCDTYAKSVPPDLLLLLKNGKQYSSTLAQDFNWGKFERRALEERWAIWLKTKHFEEDDVVDLQAATDMFEKEFAGVIEECALHDKLVDNPYYYVLKGNESLQCKNYDDAIKSYDKAIELDPAFSSNAHYNKARALLSPSNNRGKPQLQAEEELRLAAEVIEDTIKPAVLSVHTILALTGHKLATVQHIQHQLDVLHHQQNYTEHALAEVARAQRNDKDVTVRWTSVKETFKEDEGDRSQAIQEAAVNGLTQLFTVAEHTPRPWGSILGVSLLAVGQIAVGCLVLAYTASPVGAAFVQEGVSDLLEALKALITGSFSWAAWAIKKALSLATSIMTFGWQNTIKGFVDVGRTFKYFVTGAETAKQGLNLAVRHVGVSLATGTVSLCIRSAGEFCTSQGVEQLRGQIRDVVLKALSQELPDNQLVISALELDETNGDRHWQQILVNIGSSVIKELDESTTGMFQNGDTSPDSILTVAHIAPRIVTFVNTFLERYSEKIQCCQTDIEVDKQRNKEAIIDEEEDSAGAHVEEDTAFVDCPTDDASYTSTELSDPLVEKLCEEITTALLGRVQQVVRPLVNCGAAKLNTILAEAMTAAERMRCDIWA